MPSWMETCDSMDPSGCRVEMSLGCQLNHLKHFETILCPEDSSRFQVFHGDHGNAVGIPMI